MMLNDRQKLHNIVYRITNTINGKVYIGVHSTDNLHDNYMGSGVALIAAIQKHGLTNFIKDVLFDYNTVEEAMSKERNIVTAEFVASNDNYNIYIGGQPAFNINKRYCNWCKQSIDAGNYVQSHGEYCKSNPNASPSKRTHSQETIIILRENNVNAKKVICEYCGSAVRPWHYVRLHGEYCKSNPNALSMKPVSMITRQRMSQSHKRKPKHKCDYCGGLFDVGNYNKSHSAKCKCNPNRQLTIAKKLCTWCGVQSPLTHYHRFHGNNCKYNSNSNPYDRVSKDVRDRISVKMRANAQDCEYCGKLVDLGNYARFHKNGLCVDD